MEKCNNKNSIICLITFLTAIFFAAGCGYEGLGSILGTKSYHEEMMTAEFDLTKQIDKKILVLVDQPAWLDSQANLRYYLTRTIRRYIMERTKLQPENLISYDKLADFRSSRPDFSSMSPAEVGKAMDANMVLLVLIENYQLKEMAETGYFTGNLDTRAILYDTQTGEKLWPKREDAKSIKVGFEAEGGGSEMAVSRLAVASAFCTTRYFYDCPKAVFRIAEDRTSVGWENWK